MFNRFVIIFFVVFVGIILFFPVLVFAGKTEGGEINNFDIKPRIIGATTESRKVDITFNVTVYQPELNSYCSSDNSISWKIVERRPVGGDDVITKGTKAVSASGIQKVDFSISKLLLPIRTTAATRTFYGLIECSSFGLNMARSEDIKLNVPVGAGTYFACIAGDGKYACSPGDKSDCSDVGGSSCSGKPCVSIDKSKCGETATDFSYGCSSGGIYACSSSSKFDCSDVSACAGKSCVKIPSSFCGTGEAKCGDGKCETTKGETSLTCSADCSGTPGETKTFSFEITNPLKGGASDFTSLVKILAQWIFNLAIPIAVAMIVYAGILFLTAQGEPAKVTKAKDVLKYAIIGLAIILIGSGFVTLIQSILELGGTEPPPAGGLPVPPGELPPGPELPPGTTVYGCTDRGYCVSSTDPDVYKYYTRLSTDSACSSACSPTGPTGDVGSICKKDRDCQTDFECQDTICKRSGGNFIDEPCNSGRNCRKGEVCDKSKVIISDGQTLGTCVAE